MSASALDIPFEDPFILVGGYQMFATLPDSDGGPPRDVVATLRDEDGDRLARAIATTDDFGALEIDFITDGHASRRPVNIRAGHIVELSVLGPDGADGPSTRLDILPISARPNVAADTLSGTAPPGASVHVTASVPGAGFASMTVEAEADGMWTAALGESIDLVPGAAGAAYFERDGVYYQAEWAARRVEGAIGGADVRVKTWAGDVIRADLVDADGGVIALGDAIAWSGGSESTVVALRDAAGGLVPITPGTRLDLQFSDGERFSETVPPLTIHIDPKADHVEIVTLPGTALNAEAAGAVAAAVAGEDGKARMDFGASGIDLQPTTPVDIRVVGSSLAAVRAYAPGVEDVDPLAVGVEGRGVAGEPVEVTVEFDAEPGGAPSPLRLAGRIGADGRFVLIPRDDDGRMIALDGTVLDGTALDGTALDGTALDGTALAAVTLALDGRTIDLPRTPLLAVAQSARDTVEGDGEPGQVMAAEADGIRLEAIVGDDGRWTADFTDRVDLQPGMPITVSRSDEDDVPTRLIFPVFRATAQVGTGRVRIEGHPGLAAEIEIGRDGEAIGTGHCVVERTACDAMIHDDGGEPVRIQVGDTVGAYPDVGSTASFDVVELTAHIELGGFDVTGASQPDEVVAITFENDQGIATPLDTTISADATGVYDYELSSSQYDLLVPGLRAEVTYRLAGGHRLMAIGVVEVLRLDGETGVVTGLAEPGTAVVLRLTPGDAAGGSGGPRGPGGSDPEPITAEAVAGPDGSFRIDFSERMEHRSMSGAIADVIGALGLEHAGNVPASSRWSPPIIPGDRLEMTHARGLIALDVPAFGAWRASAAGAVAGVATNVGSPVRVLHRLHSMPPELIPPGRDLADVVAGAGTVGPSGALRIEAPFADATADVRTVEVVNYPSRSAEVRVSIPGRILGPTVYLPSASAP